MFYYVNNLKIFFNSVMMDFEAAERTPWRAKWPNHKLQGCLFHFTQCLWRYANKHGGVPLMANPVFKGIIYMSYSLPLVQLESLEEAKILISQEAEKLRDHPDIFAWLTEFFSYVDLTWFGRFPPMDWNHFLSELLQLTCSLGYAKL